MDMNKAKMINDAVLSTVERKAQERGADIKAEKIALNLLKEGLPIDLIVKTTGLTVEEIKEIQDHLTQ
ncbi:hypothetical protein JZO70_12680 [Enterococcus sp. 669A]|uniref:Transposase n=1 Tax=Candidatus Enterococcus moelleringii TaxID=2815325 RepID=A0ABS3LF74_9ENTE|nr:hypothetical protein [Enterococcus sp. 669A]MBO1307024.1 hypothetical protein [Enterococcus sp. 669A]